MRTIRSYLRDGWNWTSNRILLLGAEKDFVEDVEVRTNEVVSDGFRDLWVEKFRRALRLIDGVHPIVGRRLRRYVDLVVISDVQGPEYVHSIRAIRLLGPKLTHQDIEGVALEVVHEVTHARIRAWGIPYEDGNQARHERACVRAEVRMALRLPNGRSRAEAALAKLRTPWWTPEALNQRRIGEIERLELPASWKTFLTDRIRRRSEK